jgi:hypothetical protein
MYTYLAEMTIYVLIKTLKTSANKGILVRFRALLVHNQSRFLGLVDINRVHNLAGGSEVEDFASFRYCPKNDTHAPWTKSCPWGVGVEDTAFGKR